MTPGARTPRPRWVPAAALVVAGVVASVVAVAAEPPAPAGAGTAGTPAATARALCAAGPGRTVGTLERPELTEVSGLAWSRAHRGVRWAHNDSGDQPRIFAVTRRGGDLGAVDVTGAAALDWEDLALGPGPGGADHLFIGDFGGAAAGARSTVTVYRIPEPAPPGPGATAGSDRAQALTLAYPDGARDTEALLVDARTGDLVLVTKEVGSPSRIYRARAAAPAPGGSRITLDFAGTLARPPGGGARRALAELGGFAELADRVTGADASSTAGVVLVRTYGGVAVHRWPGSRSLAEALTAEPCAAPAPADLRFPQGEAIAISPGGRRYVTVSEGVSAPLVEVRATP